MNVILYGIAGASKGYIALRYTVIPWKTYKLLDQVKTEAIRMKDEYPSVERIFAIYDRPGLRQEFRDSMFDKHNPLESRFAFLDTLERYGMQIVV